MTDDLQLTPKQESDLQIARELIEAGVAIFAAPPCKGPHCRYDGHAGRPGEYDIPKHWQQTYPSMTNLEKWRPGWALAAVGGRTADILDVDPRAGGDDSLQEIEAAGDMPKWYGKASTPSGGEHYLITATGEPECNGFMPGLDLQSGTPEGTSRAFAWIAPTVRPSKLTGEPVEYRWTVRPDTTALLAAKETGDDSIEGLRERVRQHRASKNTPRASPAPVPLDPDDPFARAADLRPPTIEGREFTLAQAQDFVRPHLVALQQAPIGRIEEAGMAATLAIEHFVPAFWTADEAYTLIKSSLARTAYDPDGPSGWTADKFLARLDGRRPVLGSWKATVRPETALTSERAPTVQATVQPEPDAVQALLDEMLTPEQATRRPPPKPLIRTLLNLDSESWIVGKPGCKKSFVVLDMVGHIANGIPWQGLPVTRSTCVMIVAEGAGGLGPRIKAWEKTHGPMGPCVRILPRPVQVSDRAAWAVLIEACRRLAPGLIVLDTQARCTVGLEENSATEMGYYVHAVGAIREATGACVLTVHHTGRTGGDARGSSAIDGAQTTELTVESDGLRGVLKSTKQKDLAEAPDMPLIFRSVDLGVDEEGVPVSSLVLESPDAFAEASGQEVREDWERDYGMVQARILTVLTDQGRSVGLTQSEARRNVADRWYGGETGRAKGLRQTTWSTAWNTLKERVNKDGDPLIVNVGGQRWAPDLVAVAVDKAARESGEEVRAP